MSSRIALLCPAGSFASAGRAALPGERARQLGADALWLQAMPDDGAVLLHAAAAVATYSGGLSLVACGVGFPLHHPLREAEDLASLDGLCGGRLEIGLAWSDEVAHEQLGEEIAVLRSAWRHEPVDHEGDHHSFSGIDVHPKPERAGGPPLWIDARGAHGPSARGFAAEHGCGWIAEGDDTPASQAPSLAVFAGSLPSGAKSVDDARAHIERLAARSGFHPRDVVGVFCDPTLSV